MFSGYIQQNILRMNVFEGHPFPCILISLIHQCDCQSLVLFSSSVKQHTRVKSQMDSKGQWRCDDWEHSLALPGTIQSSLLPSLHRFVVFVCPLVSSGMWQLVPLLTVSLWETASHVRCCELTGWTPSGIYIYIYTLYVYLCIYGESEMRERDRGTTHFAG